MSSENSSSEKQMKSVWHSQIKTTARVYDLIVEEAKREDRSVSYIVSRALERYYEEHSKLKVV